MTVNGFVVASRNPSGMAALVVKDVGATGQVRAPKDTARHRIGSVVAAPLDNRGGLPRTPGQTRIFGCDLISAR